MRSNDGGAKAVETLSFGHPQLLSVICDLGKFMSSGCLSLSMTKFSACLTLQTHLGETQLKERGKGGTPDSV